jgi:hypothetical protein
MQTSTPHIYAAGDVALVRDQITSSAMLSCLWPDAMLQGLIAGQNMAIAHRSLPSLEDLDKRKGAGEFKSYPGVVPIVSSAFFGHKIASYNALPSSLLGWQLIRSNEADFYKIYTQENKIRSFSLVGSITLLGQLKRALLRDEPFTLG